jgi:holo-[acyl-carrier protein] synthase
MILGIGTDIVAIKRIRKMLAKHGERFLRRFFTDAEVAYCRRKKNAAESLAARFAAKEAAMKALGTGWSGGVDFASIEVIRAPGLPPELALHGASLTRQKELGVKRFWLSLSHSKKYAVAQVVAEG